MMQSLKMVPLLTSKMSILGLCLKVRTAAHNTKSLISEKKMVHGKYLNIPSPIINMRKTGANFAILLLKK